MLPFPHIDPVFIAIGPIKVHWYGLMYLIGFGAAFWLSQWRAQTMPVTWSRDTIHDLLFYAMLGVILGGRVGYMLFYNHQALIADPLSLFRIWEGGMSFHGGLLGVVVAIFIFCKQKKQYFADAADFLTPLVPIGLAAGRIGNFINGELWGRPSSAPWSMIFPNGGNIPRHPSQLYEFLLEGVILFVIMWLFSRKPRSRYAVIGLFLVLYGVFRTAVEFFREPDLQIGFIAFDWLTEGQLLSIPMVIAGITMLVVAYRKNQTSAAGQYETLS